MKNVKITDETHSKIKAYCDEHGLKISAFIDRLCSKHLEEYAEENRGEGKKG